MQNEFYGHIAFPEQNLRRSRKSLLQLYSLNVVLLAHHLEAGRALYNALLGEAIKRLSRMRAESYHVIWTPGHSDGHICLFRERDGVFLAADPVLPRITPNIGLYSNMDRENPLGDYLASLNKVAALPASLVLPGHGEPFTDLAGRTAEIAAYHKERLQYILHLLASGPQHANQVTGQLFKQRTLNSDEARRMAVAEVLSHLEYLRFLRQVEQRRTKDGLLLYSVAA